MLLSERSRARCLQLLWLLGQSPQQWFRRKTLRPQRILILHHLLLGDTLMLTPLLAKLRQEHPEAEIILSTPLAITPLYQFQPYGVRAVPYSPKNIATMRALKQLAPFDWAIVPGDNRFAWLARALGARWVMGHAHDRPRWKNWALDEALPYADQPAAWADMVAMLVPGAPPPVYQPAQWPSPVAAAYARPSAPYAVLHVGASSPLKHWPAHFWRELALGLVQRGLQPVWSAGRAELHLVQAIDPEAQWPSLAGALDLAQLWDLLRHARLCVCPDTGVAHLARLTHTPTLALFGPGSALLCGRGDFWAASPYRACTVDPFACRDQTILFRRSIPWVQRCGRSPHACARPRCMEALTPALVLTMIDRELLCPQEN